MKNIRKVLLYNILFVLVSCTNLVEVPEHTIECNDILFDYKSQLKLSNIHSLYVFNNNLLFYDVKTNKIILSDVHGNQIKNYGTTGKGPNEILQIGSLTVYKDSVFFFDNGNKRIGILNLLSDDLKTVPYPDGFYSDYSRFFIKNNRIYFSNLYSNKAIIVFNENFDIKNNFGEKENLTKNFKPSSNSFYHVLEKSDIIIAVDVQAPLIKTYDNVGKLLKLYDLSNFALFKGRIDEIERKRKALENSKSTHFVFFQDAYMYDGNIYLLIVQNSGDRMYSNGLLKGTFEGREIKKFELIRLVDKDNYFHLYSSICLINNQIFAFDLMTSEIHKFNLNAKKDLNLPNFDKLSYEWNKNNKDF